MIATMRPTHLHQHPSHAHSRPLSRASQHSQSPAASPTRPKTDRINAAKLASGLHSKKGFAQRKQQQQQPQAAQKLSADLVKDPTATPTPGLITLSRPLSDYPSSPASPAHARGKKNRHVSSEKKHEKEAVDPPQPNGAHGRGRQQRSSSPSARTTTPLKGRGGRRNKQATPESAEAAPSPTLLSKSAPSAAGRARKHPADSDAEWDMPTTPSRAVSGQKTGPDALTWQQAMINAGASKPVADLGAGKRASSHTMDPNKPMSSPSAAAHQADGKSSLTWQQQLLGKASARGPSVDVFADARDAATFGSPGDVNAHLRRRNRAGSFGAGNTARTSRKHATETPLVVDDVFANFANPDIQGNHGRNASTGGHPSPSTPTRAQPHALSSSAAAAAAASLAYAGPNFHNSPSPASLPAPKFSSRSNRQSLLAATSADETSSSAESGSDDEIERFRRAVSAPAPPHTSEVEEHREAQTQQRSQDGRAATIESLLERMMAGSNIDATSQAQRLTA